MIERRGEHELAAQLIPLDRELWKVENYRKFLEWRRDRLAEAINRHVAGGREEDGSLHQRSAQLK